MFFSLTKVLPFMLQDRHRRLDRILEAVRLLSTLASSEPARAKILKNSPEDKEGHLLVTAHQNIPLTFLSAC